jgi:hypothetical protein
LATGDNGPNPGQGGSAPDPSGEGDAGSAEREGHAPSTSPGTSPPASPAPAPGGPRTEPVLGHDAHNNPPTKSKALDIEHGVSEEMRRKTQVEPLQDWWETDDFTTGYWLFHRNAVHARIKLVSGVEHACAIERAFARALHAGSGDFGDLKTLYFWHKEYTAGYQPGQRRLAVAHYFVNLQLAGQAGVRLPLHKEGTICKDWSTVASYIDRHLGKFLGEEK